jgi:transcriptional regulator with XRE-family HTH domain
MRVLDGRQLTAARALAEMTVVELANAAGVTPRTLHRLEIGGAIPIAPNLRHGHASRAVLDRIVTALVQRGVELVPENGAHGAGARWLRPRAGRRQGTGS